MPACVGEKWSTYESHQLFYDPHSRTLVKHVAYMPFGAVRVRREGIVMGDGEEFLRVSVDAAGVPHVAGAAAGKPGNLGAAWEQARISGMATGHPQILGATEPPAEDDPEAAFGAFRIVRQKNRYGSEYTVIAEGPKIYPLPQSDLATWQAARPDDVRGYLHPDQAEMNEEVGPHQWVGGNLWFGKTFYNAEGATGVDGFGYFDTVSRTYKLYAPPEILRWSVSAILVEPDAVWLALYRRGEYGNYPGGLLRWDRQTAHVRQFAMDQIGVAMARIGGVVSVGAMDGLVVMRGDELASYLVDRSADGQWEMAARNR
ncbi:MAG: hypothetical protein ACLQU1_22765 [Bryobacteraceae bacterium]